MAARRKANNPEPISIEVPPTPEFMRQMQGAIESYTPKGSSKSRHRVAIQNPLDFYLNREWIEEDEHQAGMTVFESYRASGQLPSPSMNLERAGNMERKSLSERQMIAYDEYRSAMNAIRGMIGQLMVYNVCCVGSTLARINYLPGYYKDPKARMARFREALGDLIAHYKNC